MILFNDLCFLFPKKNPVPMMALHIPEEDRCLDILELIEHEDLLKFHTHTLNLYQSVCSHSNHRVAHEVIRHVDEAQMKYTIKSKCKFMYLVYLL